MSEPKIIVNEDMQIAGEKFMKTLPEGIDLRTRGWIAKGFTTGWLAGYEQYPKDWSNSNYE